MSRSKYAAIGGRTSAATAGVPSSTGSTASGDSHRVAVAVVARGGEWSLSRISWMSSDFSVTPRYEMRRWSRIAFSLLTDMLRSSSSRSISSTATGTGPGLDDSPHADADADGCGCGCGAVRDGPAVAGAEVAGVAGGACSTRRTSRATRPVSPSAANFACAESPPPPSCRGGRAEPSNSANGAPPVFSSTKRSSESSRSSVWNACPSPGEDVAAASPVPMQMWAGRAPVLVHVGGVSPPHTPIRNAQPRACPRVLWHAYAPASLHTRHSHADMRTAVGNRTAPRAAAAPFQLGTFGRARRSFGAVRCVGLDRAAALS